MYYFSIGIFVALLASTILFAYQGNLALTIGFGLSTVALIIAVIGFTFMSIFHGFVVALSNVSVKDNEEDSTNE